MVSVNLIGIVTVFSRAAERITTGMNSKVALGKPAVDIIPKTRLHIVLAEGIDEIGQEQNLGTTVIITNRVPVRDAHGEVQGAVAMFRDS